MGISAEEIEKREHTILDFMGLNEHMSPELRELLNQTLTEEAQQPVMALTMLAIQYGRFLERSEKIEEVTLSSVVNKSKIVEHKNEFDPKSILIVPGIQLPQKQSK